jgi:hypothetical protein
MYFFVSRSDHSQYFCAILPPYFWLSMASTRSFLNDEVPSRPHGMTYLQELFCVMSALHPAYNSVYAPKTTGCRKILSAMNKRSPVSWALKLALESSWIEADTDNTIGGISASKFDRHE